MRVRRSILGDWGYVPDRSDEFMGEYERKPRTHLLQKVIPSSSFFFTTPELPWIHQLPRFNILREFLNSEPTIKGDFSERRPPVRGFTKEGYAKLDFIQPLVKVKKHLENQDVVPSPIIPLPVCYKSEIIIVSVGKS